MNQDEFIGHTDEKDQLWECPDCSYRITQTVHIQAAADFLCPGCEKRHFSEFVKIKEPR